MLSVRLQSSLDYRAPPIHLLCHILVAEKVGYNEFVNNTAVTVATTTTTTTTAEGKCVSSYQCQHIVEKVKKNSFWDYVFVGFKGFKGLNG